MTWDQLADRSIENAGRHLRPQDSSVIIDKLAREGGGSVSQESLDAFLASMQKKLDDGSIDKATHDRLVGEVMGEISYRVENGESALVDDPAVLESESINVGRWESFANSRRNNAVIREQVAAAIENDAQITSEELNGILDQALESGDTITLWEVRQTYKMIDRAERQGSIDAEQRDALYAQVDALLIEKRQEGSEYASAFNPNAASFIDGYLGGTAEIGPDGTQYHFDQPEKTQAFVNALASDGELTKHDVTTALHAMSRDGKATPEEIQAVGDTLAAAYEAGTIPYEDYAKAIDQMNDHFRIALKGGYDEPGFDVFSLNRVDRTEEIQQAASAIVSNPENLPLNGAVLNDLFRELALDGQISVNEIHAVYDGVAAAGLPPDKLPGVFQQLDNYLSAKLDQQSGPWQPGINNDFSPAADMFLRDNLGAELSVDDADALKDRVAQGENASDAVPGKGSSQDMSVAATPGKGTAV
ncbi:MAG: hypothetical protein AAFV32_05265 [Myxococcota bacterium]